MEHFHHLLFEDITLDSQMYEFEIWQDRMADADLDERFFAIFEETLNERTSQMREAGKDDDPLTEYLEIYLSRATDGQHRTISQKQSNDFTDTIPNSNTASLDLHTRFPNLQPGSNDSSATVSRVINLLEGKTSLPIAHQIELYLRLSNFLPKIHSLIDPLKVLFQLILTKVSVIPVFALLEVGAFYKKLGKFEEALEVYAAASRKLDHLDVQLKYVIHSHVADCYSDLGLFSEALGSYEKAFSGQEILLGRRHSDTLQDLYMMIHTNHYMHQHIEVLRLSDKICMGEEAVPEWGLIDNLHLNSIRCVAYRSIGGHEGAAHTKKMRETLKECRESYSNDDGIPPDVLHVIGCAYHALGEYDTALDFFQLAFEACKKSKGPNLIRTLHAQCWIAVTYEALGRCHEAKKLHEKVHAKHQSVLGRDHPDARRTKRDLDALLSRHHTELDDSMKVDDDNHSRIII